MKMNVDCLHHFGSAFVIFLREFVRGLPAVFLITQQGKRPGEEAGIDKEKDGYAAEFITRVDLLFSLGLLLSLVSAVLGGILSRLWHASWSFSDFRNFEPFELERSESLLHPAFG